MSDTPISFNEFAKRCIDRMKPILQVRLILHNANLQGQLIEDILKYKSYPIMDIPAEVVVESDGAMLKLKGQPRSVDISYQQLVDMTGQRRKKFFVYAIWRTKCDDVGGIVISDDARYAIMVREDVGFRIESSNFIKRKIEPAESHKLKADWSTTTTEEYLRTIKTL